MKAGVTISAERRRSRKCSIIIIIIIIITITLLLLLLLLKMLIQELTVYSSITRSYRHRSCASLCVRPSVRPSVVL